MTFKGLEKRSIVRGWAIGICLCTWLALSLGAATAQPIAETPLHLNFTRPPIEGFIQGPPQGLRVPGFDIVVSFPDSCSVTTTTTCTVDGDCPLGETCGPSLTASQQAAFTGAEAFWESRITGYTGTISVPSVTITAIAPVIDGVGGILGSAGPTAVSFQSSRSLPTAGSMSFDTADVGALEGAGTLGDVITHEMGHVLGIGTLWSCNPDPNTVDGCMTTVVGVVPPFVTPGSGEYIGPAATARWASEFGQMGTPDVELGGGPGTADGHWNEVDGGAGLTGITDGTNDMRDELMTGWLNTPTFLSEMTLASLYDNGYETNPVTPVTLESFSID